MATFHMRRRVRELLGIRTTKTRIENMGTASLDVALDDENDTPLVEQIIDPAALDPEEAALQADMQRIVWESVTRLPEEQRSAIEAAYFSEGGRGGKAVRKALHTLRRDKRLILLWREYTERLNAQNLLPRADQRQGDSCQALNGLLVSSRN